MAKKSPRPSRKPGETHDPDDAFLARALEFTAWARERTQLLVAAGILLVLLAGGIVYYVNLQMQQAREAEQELEQLQQVILMSGPEEGKEQLRGFLDRFGGTRFAYEGRLTLAELHLQDDEVDEAIQVLEPVRGSLGEPVAIQGAFLLALAYEEQDRWGEAADLYLELADQVELSFQRKEALEGAARVSAEAENVEQALELYDRLLSELDADDPRRGRFEMRMAELEAQLQG